MERLQTERQRARALRLIPILFGVIACWLVTGGAMLAPGNIHWLEQADLAQSYLGWAFYRHDPWSWPLGANPSYGLDFHSSVYYSDSIPLLAMAFKPFAALLPTTFQYFGLWVLACFVLQAVYAWQLLGLATNNLLARASGCVFFLLAPPMLIRLGGHMALFGQWTLLAAIYLYLRPQAKRQRAAWTLLVAASMLIHAYLFLMVALIWAADAWRRYLLHGAQAGWRDSLRRLLGEIVLVVAATVVVAELAGFFMVPGKDGSADGFGFYKMNLLAVINGDGWSWFGLRTGEAAGEYEGFNYLGLGGLALAVFGGIAWLSTRHRAPRRRVLWPLIAVAVALTLLALTPHLGIGGWQGALPIPAALWNKLAHSPVQSTGRMFWPAFYLILTGACFALARSLPARVLGPAMLLLAALQVWDLHPGLANLRQVLVTRAQATTQPLSGPFWDAAGRRYDRLRLVPTRILAPGWERLAFFALSHQMGTDAVQVARARWKLFNRARDRQNQLLANGTPEPDTLYILDASVAHDVARTAGQGNAVFALDGLDILAPGWNLPLPAGAIDLKTTALDQVGSTHTAVP